MSAPTVYIGQLGDLGIAKESTLGTYVAPARYIPVYLPCNIGSPDIALLTSKAIRGIPDLLYKAQQGQGQVKSAKYKFEVEPENIGDTLMAVFGVDTKTGSGPYTHTFSRGSVAQLPTYSLTVKNGLTYSEVYGAMCNKVVLDVKAPDWVTCEADFVGSNFTTGNPSFTPSYSPLNPFKFDQATLTIGGSGVSNYSDLKITFDNKVKIQPILGGSIYSNVIYTESFEVDIACTMVVENSTEWGNFTSGTSSSLVLALTSTQQTSSTYYSLTINVPTIYYEAAPFPLKNGLLEITFQAKAVYTAASTNYTANAVLVNSVSSAY